MTRVLPVKGRLGETLTGIIRTEARLTMPARLSTTNLKYLMVVGTALLTVCACAAVYRHWPDFPLKRFKNGNCAVALRTEFDGSNVISRFRLLDVSGDGQGRLDRETQTESRHPKFLYKNRVMFFDKDGHLVDSMEMPQLQQSEVTGKPTFHSRFEKFELPPKPHSPLPAKTQTGGGLLKGQILDVVPPFAEVGLTIKRTKDISESAVRWDIEPTNEVEPAPK